MNTNRRLLAAGISLLLSATALDAAADPRGGRLGVDAPVAGEITSADHQNLNDGSRSVAWTLQLDAGQAVAIEARAGFCGRVTLFAEEAGRLTVRRPATDQNCREDDGRHRIERSLQAPRAGRYTVVFSGRSGNDFGPYSLVARPIATAAGGPLAAGDERQGLLSGDTRNERLKIDTAGRYRIDLMSAEFDPVLRLRGNGVSLDNDDGGEGTDARLNAWLEPGEYTLEVARIGQADGLYRLRVAHLPMNVPEGVELQNGGDLAGGAIAGLVQGEGAEYRLVVAARSRVDFDLQSDEFDPRIDLRGPGTRLGDDDSGEGLNARLVTTLEPGTYDVAVSDATGGGGGLFRLATTIAPATGAAVSLTPGSSHNARLATGEQQRYPLVVSRAGRHVIRMDSTEMDSVLVLVRDGEVVGMDDDGGGNNNARLEADLQPGRYEVIATGFDGASGAFRISLER